MRILMMDGDGIGPEIMAATRQALEVLDKRFGLNLAYEDVPIGLKSLAAIGQTMPPDVLERCQTADGVVMGPTDTVAYPPESEGGIGPSKLLRSGLQLYANIRPSKSTSGAMAPGMDLVIVRENTEGFYADRNMFQGAGEFMPTDDVALSIRKISRAGSLRIARAAFELAMRRRKYVTAVHKANVLKMTDGLFLSCIEEVARDFPDVCWDEEHIDAMTSHLVRTPDRFDVVVSTNMYGDILSNLASELSGGLGLAGSLNRGDGIAIAQAGHGSAPDIEGKGIANPTALLRSAAMLLAWRAERDSNNAMAAAAEALDNGLDALLSSPETRTQDVKGKLDTAAFASALTERLAR
jgi:isocitrate/isopropylmalate dehydrogenase